MPMLGQCFIFLLPENIRKPTPMPSFDFSKVKKQLYLIEGALLIKFKGDEFNGEKQNGMPVFLGKKNSELPLLHFPGLKVLLIIVHSQPRRYL